MFLHPVEFEKEHLDEASRLTRIAVSMCKKLTNDEAKTLENRLFLSSRYTSKLAEDRVLQNVNIRARLNPRLFINGIYDILAHSSKLFLNVFLNAVVKNREIGKAPIMVTGYSGNLERLLNPILENLSKTEGNVWAILCNLMYLRQKCFVEKLLKENHRAVLVVQELKLEDIFIAARKCFNPGLLFGVFSYPERCYVWITLFLLLIELSAEKRRAERLADSGCKLMLTQDEQDYLSYYRTSLLRRRGVIVVDVIHGIGFYGPNHAYSSLCLWGNYMKDKYVNMFQLPSDMMEVTGRKDIDIISRDLHYRYGKAVTIFLQPIVTRNSWIDIRDMIIGFDQAARSCKDEFKLYIKLHPLQGQSSINRLHKLAAELESPCEIVDCSGMSNKWLDDTVLCITAFSTAGLESIASGCPTIFFCKGSNDLVPISKFVPECHVTSFSEYVDSLQILLRDSKCREALFKRQQESITNFFASDAESRIKVFCRKLEDKISGTNEEVARVM